MKNLRKFTKKAIPVIAIILLLGLVLSRVYQPDSAVTPEVSVTAHEAGEHIGKAAEVCGNVASANHAQQVGGEPTFINFEEDHPNQVFTVVIWGNQRMAWDHPPEELYQNREICVTGRIEMHNDTPQIEVHSPDQISIRN